MSLDIDVSTRDMDGNTIHVWDANITHNLNTMASAAGLYQVMWRPEEISVTTCKEALPYLKDGLKKLVDEKKDMVKLNPENGWGDYDGLLDVAAEYFDVCKSHPSGVIEVSR